MKNYRSPRSPGAPLSTPERHKLANAVRELLDSDPKMSLPQLVRLTGAPQPLVQLVRSKYRKMKELEASP